MGNPSSRTLPRGAYTFAFIGPNGTTDGLPEEATVIKSTTELLGIIGRVYQVSCLSYLAILCSHRTCRTGRTQIGRL